MELPALQPIDSCVERARSRAIGLYGSCVAPRRYPPVYGYERVHPEPNNARAVSEAKEGEEDS